MSALGLVAGVWWFLKYTRGGLILRAVGESHDAAHALGYKVVKVRIMAIMFGGACAGSGGGVSLTGARAAMDRRYDSREPAGLPWRLLFLRAGNQRACFWVPIFSAALPFCSSICRPPVSQFQLSICRCHPI